MMKIVVLLMLSLVVLVAGAAATDGVDQAIRLPSDGGGGGKGLAEERPWTCCDLALCTKSIPPICRCADAVEQCAAACKDCEEAPSSPGRYVCRDSYTGWPGPTCTTDTNQGDADVVKVTAEAAETATATEVEEVKEERPWKCCDVAICTKSIPPICRCADAVEQCAAACKDCETDPLNPGRHVCRDVYTGWPGPTCTTDTNQGDADVVKVTAEAVETATEVKEERPWKCCDFAICTRSFPPICRCLDAVEQCAAACKDCEDAPSSPGRHVCMDSYTGWPGPTCTDDVQVMAQKKAAAVEEV